VRLNTQVVYERLPQFSLLTLTAANLDRQPDNEDAEAVVEPGSVRIGLVNPGTPISISIRIWSGVSSFAEKKSSKLYHRLKRGRFGKAAINGVAYQKSLEGGRPVTRFHGDYIKFELVGIRVEIEIRFRNPEFLISPRKKF